MGVLAKRPVANGHGATPPTTPPTDFADCRRRLQLLAYPLLKGANPGATVLRFTISVPGVCTALAYAKKIERWRDKAAADAKGHLPAAEHAAIRERWQQVAKADWTGQT
jgi:aryl-alcohol dehydrogenase-like predicted oxidoreductase